MTPRSYGAPTQARHELDVARLRAVETRRWLARPTFTGITAVVDAHGRVTAEAAHEAPALLAGTLRRSSATTFYVAHGDWLGRVAAGGGMLYLVVAALGRRRRAARAEVAS